MAAYIAKYATKGAETATGTLDRPIRFLAELAQARITDHARRMIRTAWTLGARPELADLRLRAWAHMLGFRGHFSTKSRRYSTTLGALRDARAERHRAQAAPATPPDGETTLVLAHNMTSVTIHRKWHTTAEVAEMLGFSLTKTKVLVLSGEIRSVKVGRNRRVLPSWVDETGKRPVTSGRTRTAWSSPRSTEHPSSRAT
ncbi:hypothetical protein GCM10010344_60270 [Streptomyces bluensis]|nr:hypothetical protein GCM10010344_60270 [Streptomyces bluensis]